MTTGILTKDDIPGVIAKLAETHEVLVPTTNGDFIDFAPTQSDTARLFDFGNTKQSPKRFFFPQRERLVGYKGDGVNFEAEDAEISAPKRVLFGVRPCDARTLPCLDRVFDSEDCRDPYYLAKRQNTVVVALACNTPHRSCFCTAMDGRPSSAEGADVLLTDLGDKLLAEVLTERGESLSLPLQDASDEDAQAKERLSEAASAKMNSEGDLAAVKAKLDVSFESLYWAEASERCLNCAACAYLCPTCHCFDIQEEVFKGGGQRVRNWDCCQFGIFTLHASGHNPRESGVERMRQRVMHKFKYFVDNNDLIACVGCGRCVENCPVNIDIREVLGEIAELTTE